MQDTWHFHVKLFSILSEKSNHQWIWFDFSICLNKFISLYAYKRFLKHTFATVKGNSKGTCKWHWLLPLTDWLQQLQLYTEEHCASPQKFEEAEFLQKFYINSWQHLLQQH